MTLDMLLYWIHLRQDVLVSEDEIWWSSLGPDRRLARAFRRHKRGVRLLLNWGSIGVCPARDLHRPYYRYRGNQQYECPICAGLLKEVACR